MKAGSFSLPIMSLLLSVLFIAGSRVSALAQSGHSPWWQEQINVMSWANLHQPEDKAYLDFAKQLGSKTAERGIFLGHYGQDPVDRYLPPSQTIAFYKQHGLYVTDFLSVEGWDPAPNPVTKLINTLKTYVDNGSDGVHLDLLFQPSQEQNSVESVARMRRELHQYGKEKYNKDILLTGNVWQLDSPNAVKIAAQTDLIWIESWGKSDLELVRMARVGRSIFNYQKPVWYHYQPDNNTQERVQHLANLPKALFSSCLFENAQFLCNYKYPVPLKSGQKPVEWKMFYINPAWQRNLVQYAAFARTYKQYLTHALPQANVLVAFRTGEVQQANGMMDDLLAHGVNFNVLVYGSDMRRELSADDLQDYKIILTPIAHPEIQKLAKDASFVTKAEDIQKAQENELPRMLKIEGSKQVLGRVYVQEKKRIIHLKQTGYSDAKDRLDATAELTVTVYAPGMHTGFYTSPDGTGKKSLTLHQNGDYCTFTVPGVSYYSLIVLE